MYLSLSAQSFAIAALSRRVRFHVVWIDCARRADHPESNAAAGALRTFQK